MLIQKKDFKQPIVVLTPWSNTFIEKKVTNIILLQSRSQLSVFHTNGSVITSRSMTIHLTECAFKGICDLC